MLLSIERADAGLVSEIIEGLRQAREVLDAGGDVPEFDDEMVEQVRAMDFSHLRVAFVTNESGALALDVS